MKKTCVAILLALALMCSQVTFAAAPPQQDVPDFRNYFSDSYDVVFIDIDSMARLSDTATIPANSYAVITTPYSLITGEHIGLFFTMTRKAENVMTAAARTDQTVDSTVFVKPTITKSGIFNVTYRYESLFGASSNGDYYLIIYNAEPDSISISNILNYASSGCGIARLMEGPHIRQSVRPFFASNLRQVIPAQVAACPRR